MQPTAQPKTNPLEFHPLDYSISADALFTQIRAFGYAIWLDSGKPSSRYGRYDILSAGPTKIVKTRNGQSVIVCTQTGKQEPVTHSNPFEALKPLLPTQSPTELPFIGGLAGYFSYDLGRSLENLPSQAESLIDLPEMLIGLYTWAIIIDHDKQETTLVFNNYWDFEPLKLRLSHLFCSNNLTLAHSEMTAENTNTKPFSISNFKALTSPEDYVNAINRIDDYIHAGDCYQVNFAQAFRANFEGDSYEGYLHLRNLLASPFSCFFEFPEGSILSLSPERFIQTQNGLAETKPIKGTIARGSTPEEDETNAKHLAMSTKDRAENVMIVDLLRNDLSKTCDHVQVPSLFEVQSFPNVHHLVSTITGRIRQEYTSIDVLAHAFPGGSITGAPKIRAMEIIEELEPIRRSVYCGSIGYISTCGTMDTNIAIRTLLCDKNNIVCWGGGGIVADSTAEQEYQETLTKIGILLNALEQQFATH